jgi:hypothetical protein
MNHFFKEKVAENLQIFLSEILIRIRLARGHRKNIMSMEQEILLKITRISTVLISGANANSLPT